MTHRTAATRYARALIEVAQKEHVDLSQIERELDAFIALLNSNPAFEQVLLNPAVPARKSVTRSPHWRARWTFRQCWRNCWLFWPNAIG